MTAEEIRKIRLAEIENKPEERYIDAYCGKQFREGNMRECPDPEIRKKCAFFKQNGFMLSTWSCKALQCQHLIRMEFTSATGCGYKERTKDHEQSNRDDKGAAAWKRG